MFYYLAHGLIFRSELPLPELRVIESPAAVDVTIRRGLIEQENNDSKRLSWSCAEKKKIYLYAKDLAKLLIEGGQEIVVDANKGADERLLQLLLVGPAFGVLLFQRDYLVLHASAVSIGGRVVAFLAESRQGKSTTAAAFHACGYSVIADDVLAVDISRPEAPLATPAFPQLKLWPEALAFLDEAADALPPVHYSIDKRVRRINNGFSSLPEPVRAVYVLADGESLEIARLPPQRALIELVRHSYTKLLIHSIKDSTHLLKCASLVQKIPVSHLKRPRSLSILFEVVKAVELDIATLKI